MATKFHWLTGATLVACVMATGSPSLAQAPRPWVDPPPDNGTSQPVAKPSAVDTKPLASTTPAVAAKPEKEPVTAEVEKSAEKVEKSAAKKLTPKRAVAEKKLRRPTREASVSSRASQQQPRVTRDERVRRGLDSGLELMTLRTIEYPDGRRVQILTRPSPGAMSELLEEQR
jgi:hypothetical protein